MNQFFNVRAQISVHIFAPIGCHCLRFILLLLVDLLLSLFSFCLFQTVSRSSHEVYLRKLSQGKSYNQTFINQQVQTGCIRFLIHNAPINSKLQHPLPSPLKTYELLKNGSFIFASFGAKIVFKCSTQLPGLIVNVPFCKGQD